MNFSVGDIPVDIIIYALVAVFLILRLRSVLGKKTGFEKNGTIPLPVKASNFLVNNKNNKNKPQQPVVSPAQKVSVNIPAPNTELGQKLQEICVIDSTFVPQKFIVGTEIVFRKVLTAFVNADFIDLQKMLIPEVYASFEKAIKSRQNQHETQKIDIKTIHSISINDVQLISDMGIQKAQIEVKIISDQINCLFDKNNEPVVGTESITEFIDFWLFERILGVTSQNISWRLKAVRSGN